MRLQTIYGSKNLDLLTFGLSIIYFVLFVVYLFYLMNYIENNEYTDRLITTLRVIFLVPLLLLYIRYYFVGNHTIAIKKLQLVLLLVYSVVVLATLSSKLAKDEPARKVIKTFFIYILPLLILASCYSTYKTWKKDKFDTGGKVKDRVSLNSSILLTLFYYTIMFFTINEEYGHFNKSVIYYSLIIISILLIVQFSQIAYRSI